MKQASVISLLLTGLMLFEMLSDTVRSIIPNWLILSLIALYIVMLCTTAQKPDWRRALFMAFAVFVVGMFIFFHKWAGGGDIKLIVVNTLWVGYSEAGLFFVLLAAFMFIEGLIIAFFSTHTSIPLGVAIGFAFLTMLWLGRIQGSGMKRKKMFRRV